MTSLPDENLEHLQSLVDLPDLSGTKYRMIERVARGGMGTVFKVQDTDLERVVGLKVLTVPDDSGDTARRMLSEARILARLGHPAIVPVHDAGVLTDNRLYYTMKLVQGCTLTEWMADKPSLNERLRLFQQVCQAVAFAHSREVIHRDLKPDNIMVGEFGEVLVMDWGIAKVLGREKTEPTGSAKVEATTAIAHGTVQGTVMGTLSYMSPEQARGETDEIDGQSDIYMLGATLFYLLTSQPPIEAGDSSELRELFEQGVFPKARDRNAGIKRPLSAICSKAMAISKADRYETATELADDIGEYLEGEPVTAYPESVFEKSQRWLSRNQLIAYIFVTYIVIRVLIFFLLGR